MVRRTPVYEQPSLIRICAAVSLLSLVALSYVLYGSVTQLFESAAVPALLGPVSIAVSVIVAALPVPTAVLMVVLMTERGLRSLKTQLRTSHAAAVLFSLQAAYAFAVPLLIYVVVAHFEREVVIAAGAGVMVSIMLALLFWNYNRRLEMELIDAEFSGREAVRMQMSE